MNRALINQYIFEWDTLVSVHRLPTVYGIIDWTGINNAFLSRLRGQWRRMTDYERRVAASTHPPPPSFWQEGRSNCSIMS